MKSKENQIKKVCEFHINDWHFTTTILPYICNEMQKNHSITTILQNSIKLNIEEILSKMNLNKTLQNQIKQIHWDKTNIIKYSQIKQILNRENGQVSNNNILINGDKAFIKQANESIQKILPNMKIENTITIIDCYNINESNNGNEIKNQYEFILNTLGIQKIEKDFQKENKKEA